MARAVVITGVPADLEDKSFEYKKGDKAGQTGTSLGFKLTHPATALSGTGMFEANDEDVRAKIVAAAESKQTINLVCTWRIFRGERDGEISDWMKFTARAVVEA